MKNYIFIIIALVFSCFKINATDNNAKNMQIIKYEAYDAEKFIRFQLAKAAARGLELFSLSAGDDIAFDPALWRHRPDMDQTYGGWAQIDFNFKILRADKRGW